MRILVTGARGMLGRALARRLDGHELLLADIADFDLADAGAVDRAVGAFRPEAVIHGAAMTAVDRCETEPDAAYRANALGSANLARACRRHDARLLAVSTDYVFPGDLDRPYHEWDEPGPRTVYGRSKAAGEAAIRTLCPDHVIVRTAWLYGSGGPSFPHTMLKLGSEAGPPLKVVDDQRGNPTSTRLVADCLARLLSEPVGGTVHATCEGEATWFEFARALFALWGLRRELVPCRTEDFPRPAPRPANSRLEKRVFRLLGWPSLPDWREELATFRREYPEG